MCVVIRKSAISDLEPAWKLDREVFKEDAWTLLDYIGVFTSPDICRFTALAEGEFAGFGASCMDQKENAVCLMNLAVHPKFQRRGIGRMLLDHIEKAFGPSDVYLYVDIENKNAIRLYEKAGYEHTGTIPAYYMTGNDALIMKKQISEVKDDVLRYDFK